MKTFTADYMKENKGCYSDEELAGCSFMKNDPKTITLAAILDSEIPTKDKYWFLCKKVFTKEQNQWLAIGVASIVLEIYEREYPGDDRPSKAIKAAEDYMEGRISIYFLREARKADDAAYAAAAYAAANADAPLKPPCSTISCSSAMRKGFSNLKPISHLPMNNQTTYRPGQIIEITMQKPSREGKQFPIGRAPNGMICKLSYNGDQRPWYQYGSTWTAVVNETFEKVLHVTPLALQKTAEQSQQEAEQVLLNHPDFVFKSRLRREKEHKAYHYKRNSERS